MKRAIMGRAAESVALASPEKINAVSRFQIAEFAELSGVVVAPPRSLPSGRDGP